MEEKKKGNVYLFQTFVEVSEEDFKLPRATFRNRLKERGANALAGPYSLALAKHSELKGDKPIISY